MFSIVTRCVTSSKDPPHQSETNTSHRVEIKDYVFLSREDSRTSNLIITFGRMYLCECNTLTQIQGIYKEFHLIK
jgi:hypothetical protein